MTRWLALILAAAAFAPAARAGDGALDAARALEEELKALAARVSPAYVMIGGGSGVVISPDGLMLTNDHVIAQQRKKKVWRVMLPVGRRHVADLLGTDVTGDVALLRIRGAGLPYLPLGDSDALSPGQIVMALGNPFSHALRSAEPTVTIGVVSAVLRNQGTYSEAIQTDAPINPGNSGGPMINLKGEVVGINGRGLMRFAEKANTGVALAIPSNQIRRFLPILEKGDAWHGHVTGLGFRAADGMPSLTVDQVRPDTVAARAGFLAGDRVLAVDGRPVWNFVRFDGAIHSYPEDATIRITVDRGGARVDLEATLIRWAPASAERLQPDQLKPGLGAAFKDEIPVTGGAEIAEVQPNSAASKGGLVPGDIVVAFEGKPVLGPADVEAMIREVYEELGSTRKTPEVRIRYIRGLEEKEVVVILGPRPRD